MNNFKEEFYKNLLNREHFYMKQYYSNFHKNEIYVAIKELKDGIYCVLISDEESEDVDSSEAFGYIKSLGKSFSLNIIILSNGEYKYTNNSAIVNKLVINKENYEVIKCDNSCVPLRQIFENIIGEKIKVNSKKWNFLKYKIPTLCLILVNIILFIITQNIIDKRTNIEINNLINSAQASSIQVTDTMINQLVNEINNSVLTTYGAKNNLLIHSGQIWRLITCAFLHSSLIHIVCNMYSLYTIGPQIEEIYGAKKYLVIYFISCITASLFSYFMSPYLSVGASGGIFGLMGALLAFAIIERKKIQKKYISSILQVIIINLFIGLSIKNIDNFAHIGGLIGGMFTGYISYSLVVKNHNKL